MKKECKLCKYIWNVLIAIDQLANAIFGGDPQETISSRAGKRKEEQKWAEILCWLLDKIDPKHCHKSILEDEGDDQVLDD